MVEQISPETEICLECREEKKVGEICPFTLHYCFTSNLDNPRLGVLCCEEHMKQIKQKLDDYI